MADKGEGKMDEKGKRRIDEISADDSFAMVSAEDATKAMQKGSVLKPPLCYSDAPPLNELSNSTKGNAEEPRTPPFVEWWLDKLLQNDRGPEVDPFAGSSEEERTVAPIDSAMIGSTTTNTTGMMAGEASDTARSPGLRVMKMMGLSNEELYRLEMKKATVEEAASKGVARTLRQMGKIPTLARVPSRSADVTQTSSLDSSEEEFKPFPEREMAKIMKTVIADSTRERKAAMMTGDLRPSRFTDAATEVFQERVDEIEERLGFIAPYLDDQADEIRNPKKLKSFHELPPPRVFETAAAASARLAGKAHPSDSTRGDGSMLALNQNMPLQWSDEGVTIGEPSCTSKEDEENRTASIPSALASVTTGGPSSTSKEDEENIVASIPGALASVTTGGHSSTSKEDEENIMASTPGGLASASHLELAKDIAQVLESMNITKDAQSGPHALNQVQQQPDATTTHTAPSAGDGVQQHEANKQSTQANKQSTRRGHGSRSRARSRDRSDATRRRQRYARSRDFRSARVSRTPSSSRSRSRDRNQIAGHSSRRGINDRTRRNVRSAAQGKPQDFQIEKLAESDWLAVKVGVAKKGIETTEARNKRLGPQLMRERTSPSVSCKQ